MNSRVSQQLPQSHPTLCQRVSKVVRSHIVTPKWPQCHPKQFEPKVSDTRALPKSAQSDPRLIPRSPQNDPQNSTVLYCNALRCAVLYCAVLRCAVSCRVVFFCVVFCCVVSFRAVLCCVELWYELCAMCYVMLFACMCCVMCRSRCCIMLWRVACCAIYIVLCVVLCCVMGWCVLWSVLCCVMCCVLSYVFCCIRLWVVLCDVLSNMLGYVVLWFVLSLGLYHVSFWVSVRGDILGDSYTTVLFRQGSQMTLNIWVSGESSKLLLNITPRAGIQSHNTSSNFYMPVSIGHLQTRPFICTLVGATCALWNHMGLRNWR